MPRVQDVLNALEEIAPRRFAFDWDRVGLQVGDPEAQVERAVVSLDRSLAAVKYTEEHQAQLLVAHHPLIFSPLPAVTTHQPEGKLVLRMAKSGISFIAAHTNWDVAPGGVNDTLAQVLELREVDAFGMQPRTPRLKLVVFAPEEAVQPLIDACSEAGAGVIGLYTRCAFMSPGTGTFYAAPGTDPTVGETGKVEEVPEIKIEMVLPEALCAKVTRAILKTHPYEEPAYDFVRLTDAEEHPLGRIGQLPLMMSLPELVRHVEERLETRVQAWGSPNAQLRTVACVGGTAGREWRDARHAGAQALITGEVKQHEALEAAEEGFVLIHAGHYATEQPGCAALCRALKRAVPEVHWYLYEPAPGEAGRPL
jgi:dinuclear metal center YbgI/SA1388 family protein